MTAGESLQRKLEKVESLIVSAIQALNELEDEARAIEGCDACGYMGRTYLALDKARHNVMNAELVALCERPFANTQPITL